MERNSSTWTRKVVKFPNSFGKRVSFVDASWAQSRKTIDNPDVGLGATISQLYRGDKVILSLMAKLSQVSCLIGSRVQNLRSRFSQPSISSTPTTLRSVKQIRIVVTPRASSYSTHRPASGSFTLSRIIPTRRVCFEFLKHLMKIRFRKVFLP